MECCDLVGKRVIVMTGIEDALQRLCRRGKHDEKWFTIYICESDSAAKDFKVKLSNESLDATWMPFKEVLPDLVKHQ